MNKNIVITSGGTGGHIIPAIVLAKKLKEENYEVLFVGDSKIINYLKKEDINYQIISSGYSLTDIKSIFNIIKGIFKSFFILFKFKPSIVISFGCYATIPILTNAVLFRKKIFLHEQNLHLSRVNKFFLRFAKYIFTSFYEIYGINIDYANKIEFTGNLIRNEIKQLYKNKYNYPNINQKFNIFITGGSGGASFFSTELIKIFSYFPDELREKINIIHQTKLEEELEIINNFYTELKIEHETKMFFCNINEKLSDAHLVISRSGVGIATELAVAGCPTVFIPSPNVINNHQLYNAQFYLKNKACFLLEEKDFDEKKWAEMFINLINDENQLKQLSLNIKKTAYLNAENKIFDFIEEEIKF